MKVLVIEDEKKIRDFLQHHLKPYNFVVDVVSDGSTGLQMMRVNHYDVVILDNVLPGKTGLEVCTEARNHGINTPIIMLSVLSEPKQKAELLDAGADDYLAKPFSFKELIARIRAVTRRPHALQHEILHCGDLVLDVTSNTVQFEGEDISLTHKEFLLLSYFMRNQDIIISKGMLIESVWEMSTDPFSNTIEAHIASLRKKLGQARSMLRTYQGRGYKFSEK